MHLLALLLAELLIVVLREGSIEVPSSDWTLSFSSAEAPVDLMVLSLVESNSFCENYLGS